MPQLEIKRQPRLLHVLRQPAANIQIGFLEHIGVVDPSRQAASKAQMHHALEPIAVAGQELPKRLFISASLALENVCDSTGIIAHDRTHTYIRYLRVYIKCKHEPIAFTHWAFFLGLFRAMALRSAAPGAIAGLPLSHDTRSNERQKVIDPAYRW
jgi:hypothetical protein